MSRNICVDASSLQWCVKSKGGGTGFGQLTLRRLLSASLRPCSRQPLSSGQPRPISHLTGDRWPALQPLIFRHSLPRLLDGATRAEEAQQDRAAEVSLLVRVRVRVRVSCAAEVSLLPRGVPRAAHTLSRPLGVEF
eukprot:scaffold78912_cov57-Phaeocystis_antarctica.AAC.1